MSQSHTPEHFSEEDEQILPVCCRMGNQGTEVIGAHTGLEINLSPVLLFSRFCREAVGSEQVVCHHLALLCLVSVLAVAWAGMVGGDLSEVLSLAAGREARGGWMEEEQS